MLGPFVGDSFFAGFFFALTIVAAIEDVGLRTNFFGRIRFGSEGSFVVGSVATFVRGSDWGLGFDGCASITDAISLSNVVARDFHGVFYSLIFLLMNQITNNELGFQFANRLVSSVLSSFCTHYFIG